MNVLSLFDGMSCGQIALERAGISYDKYYASEINKHCIEVTQYNYPNTIQIGDVRQVALLPKEYCERPEQASPMYELRDVKIDLLLAGSPCQGFSTGGKGLNFDDPRSSLFFEFVRILEKVKPTCFLLENVSMKKEWADIITEIVTVEPIKINSSIVSAQNRRRLYWTNINFTPPKNQGIMGPIIANILEEDAEWIYVDEILQLENTNTITKPRRVGGLLNGNPSSQGECIYSIYGKSPALCASSGGTAGVGNCLITDDISKKRYRRLTVCEAERLQTVPVDYTRVASRAQAHKMLGNGWTVDVIVSIFRGIK